jgi:hypothetical protein
MQATTSSPRNLDAGLIVYRTPEDRRRLREVLKKEGIYSASSWLRQQIVAKLRAAEAGSREPAHAEG